MGIAVGISMLSCIEAEIYVFSFVLPVQGFCLFVWCLTARQHKRLLVPRIGEDKISQEKVHGSKLRIVLEYNRRYRPTLFRLYATLNDG